MEEPDKKDGLSRNILVILLVLSIILSAVGAYMAVTSAGDSAAQPSLGNGGHVGLVVVPSGQGHIGMVVAGNAEEKGMEE